MAVSTTQMMWLCCIWAELEVGIGWNSRLKIEERSLSLSEGETLPYVSWTRGEVKEAFTAARAGMSEGVQGRRRRVGSGMAGLEW